MSGEGKGQKRAQCGSFVTFHDVDDSWEEADSTLYRVERLFGRLMLPPLDRLERHV